MKLLQNPGIIDIPVWFFEKFEKATSGKVVIFYISVLIAYIASVIYKIPNIFITPRFWAEEAIIYFDYAYRNHWFDALIKPHLGYYNLVNNLAVLLSAKLVPLEYAPYITTIIATIIQLFPVFAILLFSIPVFQNNLTKLIAISIILLSPPSGEVWVNTINSQFHLCLLTGLILTATTIKHLWVKRVILLISGLSGVVSLFITPLFWMRALWEKDKERIYQAVILTICALIQIFVVVGFMSKGVRKLSIEPSIFIYAVYIKDILLPFFGLEYADKISLVLHQFVENGEVNSITLALPLVSIFSLILFISFSKVKDSCFFLLIAVFIISFTSISALGNKKDAIIPLCGERYFYSPNVFLSLAIFSIAIKNNYYKYIGRGIAIILVFLILYNGFIQFPERNSYYSKGPIWVEEVKKYRSDPNYQIKIWPLGWKMNKLSSVK